MDPFSRTPRSDSQTSPREVEVYEVVYRKGDELWRFRYIGGEEASMIEAVRDIMRRGHGLDWVDLALIAHEIRSGHAIDVVRKKEGIR